MVGDFDVRTALPNLFHYIFCGDFLGRIPGLLLLLWLPLLWLPLLWLPLLWLPLLRLALLWLALLWLALLRLSLPTVTRWHFDPACYVLFRMSYDV